MAILSIVTYRFKTKTSQNSNEFFIELEKKRSPKIYLEIHKRQWMSKVPYSEWTMLEVSQYPISNYTIIPKWQKKIRHVDQLDSIEDPETNPYSWSHIQLHHKKSKHRHWRKCRFFFNKCFCEKMDINTWKLRKNRFIFLILCENQLKLNKKN